MRSVIKAYSLLGLLLLSMLTPVLLHHHEQAHCSEDHQGKSILHEQGFFNHHCAVDALLMPTDSAPINLTSWLVLQPKKQFTTHHLSPHSSQRYGKGNGRAPPELIS